MDLDTKYDKTLHIPGSPGTQSDDRIAKSIPGIIGASVVVEEKLDGENNCFNKYGLFARSHAAPTRNPWCDFLKPKWNQIKNDLGDLCIYGENLYGVHSIEYSKLEDHFYVFGIKNFETQTWLDKEEVDFYCNFFEFKQTPILWKGIFVREKEVYDMINSLMSTPSTFSDESLFTSPKEGLVIKRIDSYPAEKFQESVFKWVRAKHVQTDEHWKRNWKRAFLHHELLKKSGIK